MPIKLEDIDSETMERLSELVIEKLKASQSQDKEEVPNWYAHPQQVLTFPVNIVHTDIGPSQISVLFGLTDPLYQLEKGMPSVRLVFTHDDFVRIMDYVNKRAIFLRQSYKGETPNLDLYPEAVNEAMPLLNAGQVSDKQISDEEVNS